MPRKTTSLKSGYNLAGTARIALTSFLVDESSWSMAAAGHPDLSRERYRRLVRLSNAVVRTRPKPHYVVFPELAIPRRWARTIAHHFLRENISLITGIEYGRTVVGDTSYVVNEARLYLTDTGWVFRPIAFLPSEREKLPIRKGANCAGSLGAPWRQLMRLRAKSMSTATSDYASVC